MAHPNMNAELREASFGTYAELFGKYRQLAKEYGGISPENMISAFRTATGFGSLYTPNPYVQNRRVKGISTKPANYSKEEVGKMLETPEGNEQSLRAAR